MSHEPPLPNAARSPYPLKEPATAGPEDKGLLPLAVAPAARADAAPAEADASLADRARDTFERVKESKYGLPAAIGIGSAALLAALLYARRRRHDEAATARPASRARRKAGADA